MKHAVVRVIQLPVTCVGVLVIPPRAVLILQNVTIVLQGGAPFAWNFVVFDDSEPDYFGLEYRSGVKTNEHVAAVRASNYAEVVLVRKNKTYGNDLLFYFVLRVEKCIIPLWFRSKQEGCCENATPLLLMFS